MMVHHSAEMVHNVRRRGVLGSHWGIHLKCPSHMDWSLLYYGTLLWLGTPKANNVQ